LFSARSVWASSFAGGTSLARPQRMGRRLHPIRRRVEHRRGRL